MTTLVVAGCTPEEPVESSPPSTAPTTDPPLSDEQLLAEARDAWDAYRAQVTAFAAEPASATLEPLLDVASPDFAAFLLENFEDAADRRFHSEGRQTTVSFEPLDIDLESEAVTAAVCMDQSEERIIGDEGTDLTPADREPLDSSTVEFETADDESRLVVAGVSAFEGASDPCR